jgi:putative SOS response-associated peptidase YedK
VFIMPGRLFLTSPTTDIAAFFAADAAGLPPQPARFNVAPGQEIVVCTAKRKLALMRWGMIPVGRVNARGRPVMETIVNARSETVFSKSAFEGVTRCLVPANGWYEWTGEKRRKTAWRIGYPGGGLMAFAAIADVWSAPGGRQIWQVATVTCEPNADVHEIHHRMGVILPASAFSVWLHGVEAEAATLMQPLPDGSLHVELAADVDWDAP